MQASSYHTPVLVEEALSFLLTSLDGVYVDATLGGGGHAEAILTRLHSNGRLIGLDADADALAEISGRLARFQNQLTVRQSNFKDLEKVVAECGMGMVDGVLFDLGVSSYQLDEEDKGFSFRSGSQLDMRMDRRQSLTAAEVVNTYDEHRLSQILRDYGEEHQAHRLARAFVQARSIHLIATGKALAAIVQDTVGERFLMKTLARVFQAVRIEVNNELENLQRGLTAAIAHMKPGGRLVVISYHSLEDRIVKETMRSEAAMSDTAVSKFLPPKALQPRLKILTRKFVGPNDQEIRSNVRARSAKLRAAERL